MPGPACCGAARAGPAPTHLSPRPGPGHPGRGPWAALARRGPLPPTGCGPAADGGGGGAGVWGAAGAGLQPTMRAAGEYRLCLYRGAGLQPTRRGPRADDAGGAP